MMMTIYAADCCGNEKNCVYPFKLLISDSISLGESVKHDHVVGTFKNNYRNDNNFIESDVVVMDCDNNHSDIESDWITPDTIYDIFADVCYGLVPSRNNMKVKGKHSARPRFHVYFPIEKCTDKDIYREIKQRIYKAYPFFDGNAIDVSRFLYGSDAGSVVWNEGIFMVDSWLESVKTEFSKTPENNSSIQEGNRNSAMSHFAGKIIKKYGDAEKAYKTFLQEASKCSPPLPDKELETIWKSARRFFKKISSQEGYIPPEAYVAAEFTSTLRPTDLTDAGQAEVLIREFKKELRFSTATGFIHYNGVNWEESEQQALACSIELTRRQLKEAENLVKETTKALKDSGASEVLERESKAKAKKIMTYEQLSTTFDMEDAQAYYNFVMRERDYKHLKAAVSVAAPELMIKPEGLDKDGFMLNTPDGMYYLPDGVKGLRNHSPETFMTKVTKVAPGKKGEGIWKAALERTFCGDKELMEYVQQVVGIAAVGKVYLEALIIAFGDGRNGKSTFWNTISEVMGTYSGNLSADSLTIGCKRNVKPEMAEVKGKRLIIAAELDEGMRLNTSTIKQLCSTDEIFAEKKYKEPFRFKPSHTLVLYTNHLPKVSANDAGTWRRLVIIPFTAVIEGNDDIKNYSDYLVNEAGPAIMAWIIEGAKKAIDKSFRLEYPDCVKKAIKMYKENNDWLGHFINECCELDKTYTERSGMLYATYRNFCIQSGEYVRSTTDFYSAITNMGLERHRTRDGSMVRGIRLKVDDFKE